MNMPFHAEKKKANTLRVQLGSQTRQRRGLLSEPGFNTIFLRQKSGDTSPLVMFFLRKRGQKRNRILAAATTKTFSPKQDG